MLAEKGNFNIIEYTGSNEEEIKNFFNCPCVNDVEKGKAKSVMFMFQHENSKKNG